MVGGNDNSGRLEVYHEGQWGSVCSDQFGYQEATVACRMMGYSSAKQAFTNEYEASSLSQFKCDGKESHLSDCLYTRECPGGGNVFLDCAKCKVKKYFQYN